MIATITIESKKRYKRMVIAVCLAISMFAGSAFALSPSYQKVSMPDPYGIMPLSLSDDTTSRTLIANGSFTNTGASLRGSYSVNYSSGSAQQLATGNTASSFSCSISSGSYIDYIANVAYPLSEYESLFVSGGGGFGVAFGASSAWPYTYDYPSTVQVLINGLPVGEVFTHNSSLSSGFTLTDQLISLTSDVSTVGLRFTFDSYSKSFSRSTSGYSVIGYRFNDNVSVTPIESTVLDYEPFFERVIAWEQSIYSAIGALGDSLSESFGGVGESASRIASVFARDDDIQLRDDVDEAVTEVTDSFFTPAAEGETETEFDSATKIDKQKVTEVKQVAEGATALFDTGYEFTDGFEIIATDDSFLSWFTAETATALDSTGAVATVGDDDPYNMHFYYDHLQEIEVWKGD